MNDDQWLKLEDEAWDRVAPWELNGSDSVNDTALLELLLDWDEFWHTDHGQEEWMAWPVIPLHRQTSIFAKAGDGKSLIMLDIAAAIATGKPILGQPNPHGPRHVLYLDYEMTPADLQERLEEMGYGDEDDWTHFHYAQLPPLEPLDTPAGATQIRKLAHLVAAELVVIDTLSRAVQGDENDADTIRDFYRLTGSVLKADGRTIARLDHLGKEASKGARGTSAKKDDIDLEWALTLTDDGVLLTRGKTRIGWAPPTVAVTKQRDPLRHEVGGRGYAAGTNECVLDLNRLGVEVDASTRTAQKALKDAGVARRRSVVVDACRARRSTAGLDDLIKTGPKVVPNHLKAGSYPQNGNHEGQNAVTRGNHVRDQQEPPDLPIDPCVPPPKGEPGSGRACDPSLSEIAAFFEDDS